MSDEKPTNVGDLNFGEGKMMTVKEGQTDRGTAFVPSKPANITPPKNLPIPPPPANSGENKK